MSIEEFLARVPIFAPLNKEQLTRLAQLVTTRSYTPGSIIIREGETEASLYIIMRGEVAVSKKAGRGGTVPLTTLCAGDFVGEMTLLDGAPRSATATAVTATECIVLSRWIFNGLLRSDPLIAVAMLPILSRRLRDADDSTRKLHS